MLGTETEVCRHEEQRLVRRAINGSQHYGYQCSNCGKWKSVKKDSLSPAERNEAQEFDDGIGERFWTERRAALEQQRTEKNAAWWKAYNRYLLSEKWKDKRQRVLERDNYLCQACLKRRATQAHHLTYDHVFNEPLFDLVSICEICHDAIHERKA